MPGLNLDAVTMGKDKWISVLGEVAAATTDFDTSLQAKMMAMTLGFQTEADTWSGTVMGFFGTFEQGINDMVGAAMFGGGSVGAIFKQMGQQMISSVIGSLIKIMMQHIVTSIVAGQLEKARNKAALAASGSRAVAGSFAFGCEIGGPVVGSAMAASAQALYGGITAMNMGMDAASGGGAGGMNLGLGSVAGGAGLPGGYGAGLGGGPSGTSVMDIGGGEGLSTVTPAAEGAVGTAPSLMLAGERGPEAIVPLDQYNAGRGGDGGVRQININVTVQGGAVDEACASRIAAALTKQVMSGDTKLVASEARISYATEPLVA